MGLGVLVLFTGVLIKIQHWPDLFYGYISGPVIILIGCITLILTVIKNNKKNNAL
jgi:hypothetical protein